MPGNRLTVPTFRWSLVRRMKIAVIGGGINGIMAAWELARRGCSVDLFEKGSLMSATSRASTKMLHGGLRYLEYGHFGLVREALQERAWWIAQAPALARPIEILLPVFAGHGRPGWQVGLGVRLYDLLATGSGFRKGHRYSANEVLAILPSLKSAGLLGAYAYWDGQMDDFQLGLWAAEQAQKAGVNVHENSLVERVDPETGVIAVNGASRGYDRLVNATGPWAEQLINNSSPPSQYRLDLVRGSHIILAGSLEKGCVLQVAGERRILFVLPYKGNILLGTTEVRQSEPDPIPPSESEIAYLLANYNLFFQEARTAKDVIDSFSGVRPIVASKENCSSASRESVIESRARLVNVFGGKWTTSRSLAIAIADATLH